MWAMVLMVVLALVAWTVLGALVIGVPVDRLLARRDGRTPQRVTARGWAVVFLAVAVLVGLAVAIYTRGQYMGWFGLEQLPTSAVTR